MINAHLRCVVLSAAVALSAVANAGIETIEIARIQTVKSLSGVVRDTTGAPIAGATVTELSSDGKTVIRTTLTDKVGNFSLSQNTQNKVHHLKVSMNGFNPLLLHVKLSKWTSRHLVLTLYVAT